MGVRGEEKNSDNIVAEVYDKRLNGELQENGEVLPNGRKDTRTCVM